MNEKWEMGNVRRKIKLNISEITSSILPATTYHLFLEEFLDFHRVIKRVINKEHKNGNYSKLFPNN